MRTNAKGELTPTKVPYSPKHGRGASSTDPADWGTYEQALAMSGMAGVGFVFTEQDPFFFIDIDGALLPSGSWSLLAQELCARFAGAAIEVSQSGRGLHIIGSCTKGFIHKNRNTPLKVELYTKERFVALTGTHASGSVSHRADIALMEAVAQFLTRDPNAAMSDWTSEPVAEWRGPEDDGDLIARAMASAQRSASAAFGAADGDPHFADLFTANAEVLGRRWPPNATSGDSFDHSSADLSFANMLAFWTGKNCERMDRIMRLSALARPKWDNHHTYLPNTIMRAAGFVTKVYAERAPTPPAPPPPPPEEFEAAGFEPREGGLFMLAGAQLEYFTGCIYVTSLNKILIPGGSLLDQGRFDVVYGGHEFVIGKDGKKTTTSAWDAYAKNHNFQPTKADRMCFRPEHGTGGIIMDGGKKLANAYYPAETEETEGDASPFVDHIHKMLPLGRDAEILLTYMASVKQNPGMKAQWWPVVQGAEGNFKSYLLTIMEFAVGSHYAHMPNMKKMVEGTSNFNGWIERKLFLGLDEVYASNRREFFEGFKTTVTNRKLPIEGKGIEEVTGDNRANGMIVTNHQDGVPISGANRRYAPFFAAQQTPEDMIRDGMDAEYIRNLSDWLQGVGKWAPYGLEYGMRVMNWWLARKQLAADIDPAQLCVRCPETASTTAALLAGRGRVEQEIQEAIEEERVGFAGGWVSSHYLDRLISEKKLSVALHKRREMMQSLGYDYHPALPEGGRVHNLIMPDGNKPRLYVRKGSIQELNLTSLAAVTKAYTDAQSRSASDRSAAGQAFNA